MTERPPAGYRRLADDEPRTIRALVALARLQATALARIARSYEELVSGRCDANRLTEVVRQELEKVDGKTRQARRRSRPVRG